jgi:4'-phosphopantetheinyl transferase
VALNLPVNDIHIWRAHTGHQAARQRLGMNLLSSDERARANRYHFERDRRCFVVGRALLRTILARYLESAPSKVQFTYGPHGKPSLAEGCGNTRLCFNVADSHELILLAFSRRLELGIDLEYMRDLPDAEQIAARFFSAEEHAVWQSLPADQKVAGFYNCWTRKEAFIKATGQGLSYPLRRFEVSLTPGEPARVMRIDGSVQQATGWALWMLNPGPDYAGALAAPLPEAEKGQLRLRMLDAPEL